MSEPTFVAALQAIHIAMHRKAEVAAPGMSLHPLLVCRPELGLLRK
jgi:hypothetical protein